MKRILLSFLTLMFILSACSSGTENSPPPEIVATEPPPPTNTSPPAEPTATLEPTVTPDPVIFLDKFEGELSGAWSWVNEDPERWMITTEGWLAITADNPSVLASEQDIEQVNLLVQPVPDGDFVITTRLVADPKENFQQSGIFLILDGVNYVSILNAFCEPCLPTNGGYGVFMEGFKNAEPIANQIFVPRDPSETELYLRLVYSSNQNTVTGYYASVPDEWQEVGVVEGVPTFYQIGLGAANAPSPEGVQGNLTAYFDYLEVSLVETASITESSLPVPTATPEPTPPPEPTPLPEGILFRDDFEGYFQPGWTWINEEPDRWRLTDDGFLEITGSNVAFYQEGENIGLTNFLTRELPKGEFMITAHIIANPNENFQQATIYIYEDRFNYIALNIGFCDLCPTGGPGFYMETFIDNNPGTDAYHIPRDPEITDVYLRLVNQGGSLTGYYATEEGVWQRAGAFGNFFDFNLVGLGTTNSKPGGVENDIVSQFDYFEISLPE